MATANKVRGNSTAQPGHTILVTLVGEFIGIGLLAVFADSSEGAGKFAVALMAGWFLVFLMLNAKTLQNWTGKL